MDKKGKILYSPLSREVHIKLICEDASVRHEHGAQCVDMTELKSELRCARSAAALLAESFMDTPVDTVIALDDLKTVGAFMAEELSGGGANLGQDIAVITPEMMGDKMFFRDSFLPYVMNCHVLLLTAAAGQSVLDGVDGIRYYGGTPVGAATVLGGNTNSPIPVRSLF